MAKQYLHEALECAGTWTNKTAQGSQMCAFLLCCRVINIRTLGGGGSANGKDFHFYWNGSEVKEWWVNKHCNLRCSLGFLPPSTAATENRSKTLQEFPRHRRMAWETVERGPRAWETENRILWNLKLFSLYGASYPHTAEVKGKQVVQMKKSKTPFTWESDSPGEKHPQEPWAPCLKHQGEEVNWLSPSKQTLLCLLCHQFRALTFCSTVQCLWPWGLKGRGIRGLLGILSPWDSGPA